MSLRHRLLVASLALALALPSLQLAAEPFTFQGFLEQSGSPLNGNANLAFKLYDAQSGGTQQGATVSANSYPVLDGVFTIDLNFAGVAFAEANRWLQVEVNGTPMGPRIEILPAPVAASSRALQGRGVSATAPSSGQVLKWNGSAWAPAADAGGSSYTAGAGLLLNGTEFSANFAGSGAATNVARSDHSHYGGSFTGSTALQGLAISQSNASAGSTGLFSIVQSASGETIGVAGVTNSSSSGARGVLGHATSTTGDSWGVQGWSDSTSGRGVYGLAAATSGQAVGVWGQTPSTQGRGVLGFATATSGGAHGVYGRSASSGGVGVVGYNSATSGSTAYGVFALAESTQGTALFADATATSGSTFGVHGRAAATAGTGVRGEASAASGATIGVHGSSASSGGTGVRGEGETGMVAQGQSVGLDGTATNPGGLTMGVRATAVSPDGAGVWAINGATSGNAYGVYARSSSTDGAALVAEAVAMSGSNVGVLASTASGGGVGLRAENTATSGTGSGNALVAVGNLPSGDTMVVDANGTGNSWAIRARSAGTSAVNAALTTAGTTGSTISATVNSASGRAGQFINSAPGGQAAQFIGNVDVSGTLSKGGGSFKIDHPLDPANKYLLHSFVESPDMMNVYNGNITTDRNGYATVELPDWFETLNRDFRYQLTVIGTFAQAIVSKKVAQNRFEIRTNVPQVEVSWQVTGIRQDAWAEKNRIPVELDKAPAEKGRFLHPEAHGQPADKRIGAIAETKE
jgi:hypothetical protein